MRKIVSVVIGVLLLTSLLFAGSAAAVDDVYLGYAYAWVVYDGTTDFSPLNLSTNAYWTNAAGDTVIFLPEDNSNRYYIEGNNVVREGDYVRYVDGTKYHINVKFPDAPVAGNVYNYDENTQRPTGLIAGLIGSVVTNDKFVNFTAPVSGSVVQYGWIALTNPDGTLTTLNFSNFGAVYDSSNKGWTIKGLDLGVWTAQAYFNKNVTYTGVLNGEAKLSKYAPDFVLGKPYYFTVVSSDSTKKLEALTPEILQGGYATILLTAPVGKWNVSIENGEIPYGQPLVNLISSSGDICRAEITVPASGAVSFSVRATSTSNIKIRLYNQDSETIAKAITIKVRSGSITAEAESSSVYIGNEFDVYGTNDFGGTLYFFIKGTNFPFSTIKQFGMDLTATGKVWDVTVDTHQIKRDGKKPDAGTYTIYVVNLAAGVTVDQISDCENLDNETLVYAYTTVSVAFRQPFISLTKTPEVLVQGDKFEASGRAEGSPLEVMYYIFGTNYFKSGYSLVEDGMFTVELSKTQTKKENMAAGQYFIIVQHPMYDYLFNVGPVADGSGSYNIVLNKHGAFNYGDNTVLFNVNNRQSANAAQALCDALDSQDIDDMYVKASFVVAGPVSYIDAIPSQITKGQILTVSGTTTGHFGDVVTVELLSTAFAAIPKEAVGSASFVSKSIIIDDSGRWHVSFDTSTLNADEYTCSVAVGELEAATSKITIVDGPIVNPPINPPTTAGFENLDVSPSGSLRPGETVTAMVDIILLRGSVSTESSILFNSPLDSPSWIVDIIKDDVIVNTKYLSSPKYSFISGFDLDYDADITVRAKVTGVVPSASADSEISVLHILKSGISDSYAQSYSSPEQYVINTGSVGTSGFIINPSGSLLTGETVTASTEIKLPRGTVDTASKLSFDTPLAGDTWTVDIITRGVIVNTRHPQPPYLYVTGFDLDYETDVTVRVNVTGVVSSNSAGKEISVLKVLKSGMHDTGPQVYSSPKQHVYNIGNLDAELAVLDNAITTLDARIVAYMAYERDTGKAQSYTEQARSKYLAAQNAGTADVATAFADIEASNELVFKAQMELALTALSMSLSYTTSTDAVITTLYSKGKSTEAKLVDTKNSGLKNTYSRLLAVYNTRNVPDAASLDKLAADSLALRNEANGYLETGLLESLTLSSGWNFISVPKKLDAVNDTAAELFASVNTEGKAILSYNAESKLWGTLQADTKITPLNAYWIYSVDEITLKPVFNTIGSTPGMKSLKKGWNAVGLSAEEALPASIAFNGMNWRSYISWNTAGQKYDSPLVKGQSGKYGEENPVSLYKGGWIYLEEDGTYLGYA